jgi:Flp pilus assembly protein TadG
MIHFMRKLANAFRKEDGTASIEFLFAVPILMTIFMASFEAGMFMARHVMLDRAVDMTMRELRLGLMGAINHNDLRTKMCTRAVMLHNCNSLLKIEMTPLSTITWAMPAVPPTCVDRTTAIDPVTNYVPGGSNEPVIVRVCVRQNAMFPTTGIGLALPKDAQGGYALTAKSIFVNEPK